MDKPREWTLESHKTVYAAIDGPENYGRHERVHVIEKSAYDAVVEERDALKKKFQEWICASDNKTNSDFEAINELVLERDQLRADLDAAISALEDLSFWACTACEENQKLRDEALASIKARLIT